MGENGRKLISAQARQSGGWIGSIWLVRRGIGQSGATPLASPRWTSSTRRRRIPPLPQGKFRLESWGECEEFPKKRNEQKRGPDAKEDFSGNVERFHLIRLVVSYS
jgi:hypothetical protein